VSTIFLEVDAVALAIVDPQFPHIATHAVHIGHIALLQAGEGNGDFGGSTRARSSNHCWKGLRPRGSVYSRASIVIHGNRRVTSNKGKFLDSCLVNHDEGPAFISLGACGIVTGTMHACRTRAFFLRPSSTCEACIDVGVRGVWF
jgi:hypothetical protein